MAAVVWLRSFRRGRRSGKSTKARSSSAARNALLFSFTLALPWAILAAAVIGGPLVREQLVVMALAAGMSAAGSVLLAPISSAAICYMATILAPVFLNNSLTASGRIDYALSGLTLSYGIFLFVLIRSLHKDLNERDALRDELESRQAELLVQNQRFDIAIASIPVGISMFDADRGLNICNENYRRIYGFGSSVPLEGRTRSELAMVRFAHEKCDTSSAPYDCSNWEAEFGRRGHEVLELGDGRVVEVVQNPTPDGGAIFTHQDITERQRMVAELAEREQALRLQNQHFDVAISNIRQGICLFDDEQRLIVANARFSEIYDLDPARITPGTTLRQIIELRYDSGVHNGESREGYINERLMAATGNVPDTRVHELTNGRVVSIRFEPLAQGGWVVTHDDITDAWNTAKALQQQNSALEEREEELRIRNMQFDAAMNHMGQGLIMFDAECRIVLFNDRFASMYDLKPEELKTGLSQDELFELRIANGTATAQNRAEISQAVNQRFTSGEAAHCLSTLPDGRCVRIEIQPMAGGGWLTTHEDVTAAKINEDRVLHLSRHDALTGLPNRTVLVERIQNELLASARGTKFAVHFIDLDHFKAVNDTLGHGVGDQLLCSVSARLNTAVRAGVDLVVRLGGDEFAIVQGNIQRSEDATVLAQRVINDVGQAYEIEGFPITISASIGIAMAPDDGDSAQKLLQNSDLALYRAKELGRSDYHFFEPSLDQKMQKRRELETDLRNAIETGGFELHYQPYVAIATGEICGAEALIRWRHPERGLIPPDDFIPLAEDTGLITPIGEWAIREACATAATWPEHIAVAVNLSPLQFRKPGLPQTISRALGESKLDPKRLEFEITETVLLDANDVVFRTLTELRQLGVRVALDDFGTGYSSLSYLRKFPFDKLKIDRAFIENLGVDEGAEDLVDAIVAMADAFKMQVTAEGIETEHQLAVVDKAGCAYYQGYLFSRPLPASALEALLNEKSGISPLLFHQHELSSSWRRYGHLSSVIE